MEQIKRLFQDLSLRRTFILYMLVFLLIAGLLSAASIEFADSLEREILSRYENESTVTRFATEDGVILENYFGPDMIKYFSSYDRLIYNTFCYLLQTWSIPFFFGLGCVLAGFAFYRHKLKEPIEILSKASENISKNQFDFTIEYDKNDEMGLLCQSFENMRHSLDVERKETQRAMEERKRQGAAFAHDLRTPLTILRGYTDILSTYLPDGKLSQQKVLATVSTMSNHVRRLEDYVESMGHLQTLEDVKIHSAPVELKELARYIRESGEIMCTEHKLRFRFVDETPDEAVRVDDRIIIQVFENLIANAVRFAADSVEVTFVRAGILLSLYVGDDGPGFSEEELERATHPFFKGDKHIYDTHFGLGLNICKTLCEKHGGAVTVANGLRGGALVQADFRIGA